MTKLPHVIWLRSFEAAARHSSFSAAAEELNLTPAAVSHQIRLLEDHLGVQLFKRRARGVSLTDLGQAYSQPIRKSFQEMQHATQGLFQVNRKKRLRVRASISYAALILAPRLHEFQKLHPDIEVELSTAVWSDPMTESTIDADIRYGMGDWDNQTCWKLSHEFATVVCHPDFAKSLGSPLTIEKVAASDVVQVIGSEIEWVRLSEHFGLNLPLPASSTKADSALIALQLIASGTGAAIIHESFAQQYIDSGLLVSPFEYRLPMRQSYFLAIKHNDLDREELVKFQTWMTSFQ
ncbi:LysR family transcriptional regulator [Roseibium sp. CAU 1637]|uniref:LysR family transcriptional regulator n=1 Tax=Roseibium limicola TaxID=2816037 RepID=A0A939J3R8_9HYPH|nr:LysR family transcriptional regulator [Roseibium limicola]MBO0343985.1 LysR family transcriptional regulator [Roseibium limicola]